MTQNVHGLQHVSVNRNYTGLLHIRGIICALQTDIIHCIVHNKIVLFVTIRDLEIINEHMHKSSRPKPHINISYRLIIFVLIL